MGSIMKGGAVALDGRIEPGDMILQVPHSLILTTYVHISDPYSMNLGPAKNLNPDLSCF